MKMEFQIEGFVLILEAEGVKSVQVVEAAKAAPAVPAPAPAVPVAVAAAEASPPAPPAEAGELFAKLSQLRKRLAAEQSVPPYVVFQDKVLREMVERMPSDLPEMSKVPGVGLSKLEKYGERFLEVLSEGVAA